MSVEGEKSLYTVPVGALDLSSYNSNVQKNESLFRTHFRTHPKTTFAAITALCGIISIIEAQAKTGFLDGTLASISSASGKVLVGKVTVGAAVGITIGGAAALCFLYMYRKEIALGTIWAYNYLACNYLLRSNANKSKEKSEDSEPLMTTTSTSSPSPSSSSSSETIANVKKSEWFPRPHPRTTLAVIAMTSGIIAIIEAQAKTGFLDGTLASISSASGKVLVGKVTVGAAVAITISGVTALTLLYMYRKEIAVGVIRAYIYVSSASRSNANEKKNKEDNDFDIAKKNQWFSILFSTTTTTTTTIPSSSWDSSDLAQKSRQQMFGNHVQGYTGSSSSSSSSSSSGASAKHSQKHLQQLRQMYDDIELQPMDGNSSSSSS